MSYYIRDMHLPRNKELPLRIISWLQIIGGVMGLILMGRLLLDAGTINGPLLLIFLTGIGLFIFSSYAGKTLLNSAERSYGIVLSFINQALQLFQWSLFGYGLSYTSGAEVAIGIKGLSVTFDFSVILSSFEMHMNSNQEFYVKINLIAAFVIVLLFYVKVKSDSHL